MRKKLKISSGKGNLEEKIERRNGRKTADPKRTKPKANLQHSVELRRISYFQLYRYATLTDKIAISLAILCSLASGVGMPLVMILFGNVTGAIVDLAMRLDEKEMEEALMATIMTFVVGCLIIAAAVFVLSYVAIMLFNVTCIRQVSKIRASFMKSMLDQDIGWYDLNQTGDFTSLITGDIFKIEESMGDKVATCLFYMSTFLSGVIAALFYGWELALICLIGFPVHTGALAVVSWITTKFSMREMQSYGAAGAIAEEVLSAVKTVMAFGGQQKEIDRYKVHLTTAYTNNTKRALLTGVSNGLMWFFIFASYSLSFYYGIGLILGARDLPADQQTYNAGTMITVFFNVLIATFNLTQCMPYFQIFGVAQGAASKIFHVIDQQPEINASKGRGATMEKCEGRIKFHSVEFHYPSRKEVPILKGVDFEISPGETVALVGSSGCGKSTCIQLLQRFYDPIDGKVTIDGHDLKDLDLTWLRSKIGVVGQEPVLFAMSIEENIKFGNPHATEDDIVVAAKRANAHSFIKSLPEGYQTLVGDRGSHLSGGQKQRIAIARALVREPTILLLDEATSALDTQSEALVQKAIDSIRKNCTTLIVAHRLSTIRNANKIVVFSEGNIVEIGTHVDLMASKGVYYNLVIKQTSDNIFDDLDLDDRSMSTDKQDSFLSTSEASVKSPEEKTYKNISGILHVMALNRPEWWQITIGALSAIVAGAALPVYAVVFGDVIGVLSYDDPDRMRSEGNMFSLYFLIIGIACGISTFLQWFMIGVAGEKLTKRVRGLLFETILRQEPGWFDQKENSVGSVCAKLSSDAANIQGASGHPLVVGLNSISTLVIAVGISMYFEWRLTLVSMAIVPLIFIGTYFETRYSQRDGSGNQNYLEQSTKIAVDAISNVRTVTSLGCEDAFYTLFNSELSPYYRKAMRSTHLRALMLAFSRSLMNIAYVIAFYYGGTLIISERLDYSIVFKVSEGLISGAWSIGNVMAFSPNFQKAVIASNKMLKLVKRVPKIRDGPNSTHTGWPRGDIDYKRVTFSYPTRSNVTVLNSLNLTIPHGKTVALVGPSGCGKSTVVQLLQRFYEPEAGNVTIDDVNLEEFKIASLRSRLGIVSQEPNLFDRTIEENIAYGDNQRIVPMDEIIKVAKEANIHTFVSSLPLGYQTRLGDKGTQLSGGQKQRIAIARALVRNPEILMLDEATSALDMESEKIVQEALDKAKEGRTCITIAHRLITIQDADVICVFDKGRVREEGTHVELLARRGLYYKLCKMQKRKD